MIISKKPVRSLTAILIGLISSVAMANPVADTTQVKTEVATQTQQVTHDTVAHAAEAHAENHEALSPAEKVNEHIQHHLQDSYDFILYSDEEAGTHVGFSLPVILIDGGLKVFSASVFNHGESVANIDGVYYKLHHNKIYKTDAAGTLTLDEHHHPTNEMPLNFSITKNVFSLLITAFLLILMFTALARTYKKGPNTIPTGFSRVLEPLVLFVRDEIARPNIGEKQYKKFMPFLLTVFFLIWLLNLIGLTPLGINVTGNIAVTFCLAIFTLIITNFSANKSYWGHIFWMPGVPVPMKIILAPIELLGIFTKPFSLMIRLFANITAGHSVVMGLLAIIFVFKNLLGTGGSIGVSLALTTFISFIELLVAFLQAFIFTMMSSLFIGMAVQEHDHGHDHDHDHKH